MHDILCQSRIHEFVCMSATIQVIYGVKCTASPSLVTLHETATPYSERTNTITASVLDVLRRRLSRLSIRGGGAPYSVHYR